jgi:hypothetical protein
MFIKIIILLAYVCYVHPHVEQHLARNISNHNTQSFISIGILFALGYLSVSF